MPLTCTGYFNSGVLLMNVDVFRERNLVRAVLDYAVTHRDRLTCPDQDALNGALCELIVPLHPRWNWHDGLTRRILKNDPREQFWRGVTPRQAVEAALEPGILHYQGCTSPGGIIGVMKGNVTNGLCVKPGCCAVRCPEERSRPS